MISDDLESDVMVDTQPAPAVKGPPDNNGYWIAYYPSDVMRLVANLQELSCTWIAPRVTDFTKNSQAIIDTLKKSGFKIYPWVYCTPFQSTKLQNIYSALDLFGCDGMIIDAEKEFNNQREEAKKLVGMIRDVTGSWLAHAPFALPIWHNTFPYVEFASKCDAVMPQLYAYEFDDSGYKKWISNYEEQWLKFENNYPEAKISRRPIGCSYRPKSRILGGVSTVLPLMDENLIAKDVSDYCEYFSGGLYSFEAMSTETYKAMVKARNPYA